MAIRFPAENGEKKSHLGRIRSRLRICPKCCFPFCAAAEERIATSRCSRPAPRNDIHKPDGLAHRTTWQECTAFQLRNVLTRAEAHLSFACHCEERSDAAIRFPAEKGRKK